MTCSRLGSLSAPGGGPIARCDRTVLSLRGAVRLRMSVRKWLQVVFWMMWMTNSPIPGQPVPGRVSTREAPGHVRTHRLVKKSCVDKNTSIHEVLLVYLSV